MEDTRTDLQKFKDFYDSMGLTYLMFNRDFYNITEEWKTADNWKGGWELMEYGLLVNGLEGNDNKNMSSLDFLFDKNENLLGIQHDCKGGWMAKPSNSVKFLKGENYEL